MRLIIDTRLLGRGGTTGVPGYTRDLIATLLKQYPENLYALFYNSARPQNKLPEDWLRNPRVRVINRHIPNRLLSLVLRFFHKPTIETLIAGSMPSELLWIPHLDLLTTSKIPRVITVHDISFLQYPEFFSKKYHLWSWLQNQVAQIRSAQHIIAVSEYTKHDLITELQIPPEKITVIHSGINPSFSQLSPSDPLLVAYAKRHALHKPFFLYLGTIESRKNIPLLIRAFDEYKQDSRWAAYELVIAGRPGHGASEIERLARASSHHASIRFISDVKDDERVILYNLARCFVFPSFFEGFGFPPLEAQACGTPVIASNRTSLPEMLGNSALLIDPWNVSALAQLLCTIETDAKVRETIVRRGKENADRFTWQRAAEKTMQVFKSVVQ